MAPTRYVICKGCGRQFDVNKEGGLRHSKSGRYYCVECARTIALERPFEEGYDAVSPVAIKQSGSVWKNNWKAILGGLFTLSGVITLGQDFGAALLTLVIGLALLAWHFVPGILAKKQREQELAALKAGALETLNSMHFTCSKCGADTKGPKCEYCGTPVREYEEKLSGLN